MWESDPITTEMENKKKKKKKTMEMKGLVAQ